MNEMIERVARAICHSAVSKMVGGDQSGATGEVGWSGDGEYMDRLVDLHWKEYAHTARAAIEAMREPTEPMFEIAGTIEDYADRDQIFRHAWRAMIHAALNPP